MDCVLVTGAYQLLDPDTPELLSAIGNSTAKKFVENPISTLVEAKRNGASGVILPIRPEKQ
jgi:hypothetical protein